MANAWVQSNKNSFGNNTATRTLQYASNVGSGSLLVMLVGVLPGSGTAQVSLTVTDDINGSWTQAGGIYSRNTSNGVQCSWWYFANSAGGSRPTVSVTPGVSAAMGLGIAEFSVTSPTSVSVDGTSTNNNGSSANTSVTTGTCSVAGSGELMLAGFAQTTATQSSITVASPFTIDLTQLSAASMSFATGYDVSPAGSQGATFTLSNNARWAAMAVSFITAAAGGGGPFPHYTRRRCEGGMIHMGGGMI